MVTLKMGEIPRFYQLNKRAAHGPQNVTKIKETPLFFSAGISQIQPNSLNFNGPKNVTKIHGKAIDLTRNLPY
jgi:hypothetical protein